MGGMTVLFSSDTHTRNSLLGGALGRLLFFVLSSLLFPLLLLHPLLPNYYCFTLEFFVHNNGHVMSCSQISCHTKVCTVESALVRLMQRCPRTAVIHTCKPHFPISVIPLTPCYISWAIKNRLSFGPAIRACPPRFPAVNHTL